MNPTLEQRIVVLVAEQSGEQADQIQLSQTLDSLGLDSIDALELIMAVEEKFDIEIPDEDAERVTTIQTLVDVVRERMGAPA